MEQLKTEHLVYMDDDMYLPIWYKKSNKANEPFFEGRGNHSVSELEDVCEKFKE